MASVECLGQGRATRAAAQGIQDMKEKVNRYRFLCEDNGRWAIWLYQRLDLNPVFSSGESGCLVTSPVFGGRTAAA